ncbi:hypothetical protein LJC16_02190 [Bacteroidales bacterium OttesenSCG-928-C19]|nr:hypothetical protein [Bacteroidales bacterium OttesenSCG-928-C19]
MDRLFEAIADRLEDKIPELKWIDWEAGQIDYQDEEYPFQFPCCFIDIEGVEWGNVGERLMIGKATVNLRVCFDIYEDFNNKSPDRKHALKHLRLINKIQKHIQHFSGEHFNQLNKVRTFPDKRADQYKCINLVYQCGIRDNFGMVDYEKVKATPKIAVQLK